MIDAIKHQVLVYHNSRNITIDAIKYLVFVYFNSRNIMIDAIRHQVLVYLKWVLWMRPQKPRSRVTAGAAR